MRSDTIGSAFDTRCLRLIGCLAALVMAGELACSSGGGGVSKDAASASSRVVISLDHFKRFLAGLRALVGGRIRSYETLLDRARREALMRMKEAARDGDSSSRTNGFTLTLLHISLRL